jgi:hypothetical protein
MSADLEQVSEAVERGELDLASWAAELDWATAERLRSAARAALEVLPLPIRAAVDPPPVRRRRTLERILGQLMAAQGDYELLTRAERVVWLRGGSHVDYLKVLVEAGRAAEAAGLARALVTNAAGDERDELEHFIAEISHPPGEWEEYVARLADDPTEEAWDALFRFSPPEHFVERQRYTIDLLLRLGVSPDHVFRLAARDGASSHLLALVEEGQVDPHTIEEHAATSNARQMWLGYAARAACVRGDALGTLRLVRAAHTGIAQEFVDSDLRFISEHADDSTRDVLASGGISLPR